MQQKAGLLTPDFEVAEGACRDYRGRLRTAEEAHDMSLANLNRHYCTVTQTQAILAAIDK